MPSTIVAGGWYTRTKESNMSTKSNAPSPNDQRSNVKNPTSPQYGQDRDNRLEQGHPNPPPAPATTPGSPPVK